MTNEKSCKYFDTVYDLLQYENFTVGEIVCIKGYDEVNDGYSAKYEIISKSSDDFEPTIDLNNNLQARLIISNSTINVKHYGAKCNGIDDDAPYVQKAFNYIMHNTKIRTLILPNNLTLLSRVVLNNKCRINIISEGYIFTKAKGDNIVLHHIYDSKIELYFKDGGNCDINDNALRIYHCYGCKFTVTGNHYQGTVLNVDNVDDNGNVGRCNISLMVSNGCYRALLHGNELHYMYAFGEYENITDFNSKYGITFQNSSDISVKHLENYFEQKTDNSINIINSSMHFQILAIGGIAKNLLFIRSYRFISIDELYCCNEDYKLYPNGTRITNAIGIGDSSKHHIHINTIINSGCKFVVNICAENRNYKNIGRLHIGRIDTLRSEKEHCKLLGINNVEVRGFDTNNIYGLDTVTINNANLRNLE